MQRSIGICFCWTDLEKRRKAIDLFVQRQLEVVDGVPKKVFYECGATPTNCKYNVTAVRNEVTGHFELFEMGEHSHPIRANISSGFLVDQVSPLCPQPLQPENSLSKLNEISPNDSSKISIQDDKVKAKDQPSSQAQKRRPPKSIKNMTPPKKVLKMDKNKIRDSSNESSLSEMTSTTNCSSDSLFKSTRRILPRAAKKTSMSDADKRASLNLTMSPCEPMTRLRARTLLNKNPGNPIVSKTIVTSNKDVKVKSNSNDSKKDDGIRLLSYSSSSSTKNQQSKNKNEIKSSSDSETHEDFQDDMPMTIRSPKSNIVWHRIASIFSEAALLKFQQDNHMIVYKHQIWKCNLRESSNKINCSYMMRVFPKKNISSTVFYVYFSGSHNPDCNKYQHELQNNTLTTNEQSEKNGNNKLKNTSEKVSIKDQNEISKKNARKTRSLVDSSKSNKITSDNSSCTSEVAALFIDRYCSNPTSIHTTSTKSTIQERHENTNNDDSVLFVQSPPTSNKTFPHFITSTPKEPISATNIINGGQNLNFSVTPIRFTSAPIITLTPSEAPRNKKSLESEKTTETLINSVSSPMMCLPKDWYFTLESVFSQLSQLSDELHLKFTSKGSNLAVFSSEQISQNGQVLVLTDKEDDDIFVKIMEYGDWKLISEEMWPKASFRQFFYAVRGKLIEFFFVIPNDSNGSSPVENRDKSMGSEANSEGTATASSSVQVKHESDDDRIVLTKRSGKKKNGNLEISLQPTSQNHADSDVNQMQISAHSGTPNSKISQQNEKNGSLLENTQK